MKTKTEKVTALRVLLAEAEQLMQDQSQRPVKDRVRAVYPDGFVIEDVGSVAVDWIKHLIAMAEREDGGEGRN